MTKKGTRTEGAIKAGSNPARFYKEKPLASVRPYKNIFYEVRKMKNAILKICEKLRGYSDSEPYFEVTEIKQNDNGTYTVTVQFVDPVAEQGAQNESN